MVQPQQAHRECEVPMTADEIRDFLSGAFPDLVAEDRHNPDGWSFFYQRRGSGRRIITVTQSSVAAGTRVLRAISNRRGTVCGYSPFDGGPEQLRQIVDEEIMLYREMAG
jgi:hypothetical protein